MKRLFIDAGVFALARDGYDAETDSDPRHMKIDTRRGAYLGVFMSGLVDLSTMILRKTQVNGVGTYRIYWGEIFYGRTFERPPVVLTMFKSARFPNSAMPTFFDSTLVFVNNGGVLFPTGGITQSFAVPYTDRVRFVTVASVFTAQVAGPSAISYIVAHS